MRGGLIFFGLLMLLAIAAIAALLYRPATVIGISDKSLAYSVRGEAGGIETGNCQGREERYVCTTFGEPSPGAGGVGPRAVYEVTTEDYGCWDAKLGDGGSSDLPKTLEGCITIKDLMRLDD